MNASEILLSMKQKGRLPHAFLLTGEKGSGKLETAKYIAKLLMCENGNACQNTDGQCRHCKRIDTNTHPDVILPERTGKKMIYTKDAMRNICTDAYTKPNDCDCKVYIFADCENIEEATQNLMLKLIEDPPQNVYFIFTAISKSAFLPTIISRVVSLNVADNYADENTLDDIDEETLDELKSIINAIADNNEYELLKAFANVGENREKLANMLLLTDLAVRDSAIIRLNSESGENVKLLGSYYDGSLKLSQRLSYNKAVYINDIIHDTLGYLKGNVNVSVAVSSLAGRMVG